MQMQNSEMAKVFNKQKYWKIMLNNFLNDKQQFSFCSTQKYGHF